MKEKLQEFKLRLKELKKLEADYMMLRGKFDEDFRTWLGSITKSSGETHLIDILESVLGVDDASKP